MALAKSKAAAKTNTVNAITSPITQPLIGMPAAEPEQPPPMNYGYQQSAAQNYYGAPQQPAFEPQPAPPPANLMTPYQPQAPQQPVQNNPYGGFQPQQGGFQPQQPVQQQMAPAPEPPKPVEKGPIPSEHQILQEVFDGLKNKCLTASNHPVCTCFLNWASFS